MKILTIVLFLFTFLLVFSGFQKKPIKTQGELMTEYIDAALEQKRSEEWKKCYARVVKDAEQYVDSIIYQRVNFNIGDTLKSPGKPARPNRPFDTLKLDTSPIVPILRDTVKGGEQ